MTNIRKIVVIGPESTGKSTLCEQLAGHYDTLWCPEYAREYLLTHGIDYSFEDLLAIAKGQLELEDGFVMQMQHSFRSRGSSEKNAIDGGRPHPQRATGHPLLFIDTDMYVMKVWCEFVFEKCHRFILEQIVERKYDLYLLCHTDLPWVKDELREYPDPLTRQKLFFMYRDLLVNQSVPWVGISGDYRERLRQAVAAVDGLLLNS